MLLARRGEDVEDDAAPVERPAAVGNVGRRLPEVAGLHGVLDAVLDPDPFALEAHAPLLVRMRVHRRHRASSGACASRANGSGSRTASSTPWRPDRKSTRLNSS